MFFTRAFLALHDEWLIITATYITLPNKDNLLSWNAMTTMWSSFVLNEVAVFSVWLTRIWTVGWSINGRRRLSRSILYILAWWVAAVALNRSIERSKLWCCPSCLGRLMYVLETTSKRRRRSGKKECSP